MFKVLQPPGWAPAKGYANGIEARGRMVFVAGMIGWNALSQFETDDFVGQCRQALAQWQAAIGTTGGRAQDRTHGPQDRHDEFRGHQTRGLVGPSVCGPRRRITFPLTPRRGED